MCIALLTTSHPSYSLILLSNRDEYLNRPTSKAHWWGPDTQGSSTNGPSSGQPSVYSGRDLLRSTQGTWLGITRTGRIAVLTNYREEVTPAVSQVSRGEIIKMFLTLAEDVRTEEWVRQIVGSGAAKDAGGFTLLCGRIGGGRAGNEEGKGEGLAVVSNRAHMSGNAHGDGDGRGKGGGIVPWVCIPGTVQTVGVSNAPFSTEGLMSASDRWPKIVHGEEMLVEAVQESVGSGEGEEEFLQRLLGILSDDALTRGKMEEARRGGNEWKPEEGLSVHVMELRNTILVPPLGKKDAKLRNDEIAAAKEGDGRKLMVDEQGNETKKGEEQAKTEQLGVSGLYGTQKQSVVLVRRDGGVRFLERTLFDENSDPCDVVIEESFMIEGWNLS